LADITSNTDDALHAIKDLKNPKITIQLSDENLDILQNWRRIKDLDKKEYMTILGYDDILSKGFLNCINNLINTDPDASLYHTHFNYINSNSEAIKEKMELLLNDTNKLIAMKLNAIESVKDGFTWNHYGNRWKENLEKII
jgi:hypothetical protein